MTPEKYQDWLAKYGKGPNHIYPGKVSPKTGNIIPIADGTGEGTVLWFLLGAPWEPDRSKINITAHQEAKYANLWCRGKLIFKPPIESKPKTTVFTAWQVTNSGLDYVLSETIARAESYGYSFIDGEIDCRKQP